MQSDSDVSMLEVRALHKAFHDRPILQGVDLYVCRGETLAILGQSGSGKTVLLKHLNGLLRPNAGQVFMDGIEISRLREAQLNRIRLKIGMLFQEAALFDSLTVGENVGFALFEHARLDRAAIRQRVRDCLAQVGLEGSEPLRPAELSGGMKKRVGLARALALQPSILLYDEPTSGLDPAGRTQINALIRRLQRELGVTSVVVTHDIESAQQVADRIALLHWGRIALSGSPETILQSTEPALQAFWGDRDVWKGES
jgi:phospholipid/cholesterol/gamma-HCH transport system ATP-binding protein